MLIGLASTKGSPGVTSTALTLAAVWPRPVVLLEADAAGGDLAYRARAAHGGPVSAHSGLLRLASELRGGTPDADAITGQAQLLACGVSLVPGVSCAAQTRGMGGIWSTIAGACTVAQVDVLADLGRLERGSPLMPLAAASHFLLPVASATLESVMHLSESLTDLMGALMIDGPATIVPLLVGPDTHAARDCADLDDVLARAGMPTEPTLPIPHDPKALARLEQGEQATGRLGRTLLLRAARAVTTALLGTTTDTATATGTGTGTQTGVGAA